MSVINALASAYRDPNEQMMQSTQYATSAWDKFMNGMIMKRAGDEILDIFTEKKGKVEPGDLAAIASKYHMPLNQFGETIGLLQKSRALEAEKEKWGELTKATGEGPFRKGTVWARDPKTGKPTVLQEPLAPVTEKPLTAQQKIENARKEVKDAEGARKRITALEVLKGKVKSQGLSDEDIAVLGKESSELAVLLTGFAGKKLSPDLIKEITDTIEQEIAYYREKYTIPNLGKGTKPTTSPITHTWNRDKNKVVPIGK